MLSQKTRHQQRGRQIDIYLSDQNNWKFTKREKEDIYTINNLNKD